jgi:hypothetical protein
MALTLDEDPLVSTLEEVADPIVPAVEALRVDSVQLPHPARQVRLRSLDDEVVVVRHQAIGVARPAVLPDDITEDTEERPTVTVVEEDRLAGIAPCGDVVESARKLDTEWPCHGPDARKSTGQTRSETARCPHGVTNSQFKT